MPETRLWSGRRIKRLALALVAALVTFAGVGIVYQTVATTLDERRYLPPGQMVDVGGRSLHLYCTGTLDGRPTVILEQGGGGFALAWFRVQPEVARLTRVCAYHRAGLGWSDPGPLPRDGVHIAQDLHALMQNGGIRGPYVLVGHSYGGLFIRAFASEYPGEVAGLVLLDSAHPDQWTRTSEGRTRYAADSRLYDGGRILVRFGLLRVAPNPFAATQPDWPAELRAEWRALAGSTRFWETTRAESRDILATMAHLRAAAPLPSDLPLVVVTAGRNTGADGRWREYQLELASLSTNSAHVIVEEADHAGLWAEARHVPASVEAIRRVVDAAAAAGRLH